MRKLNVKDKVTLQVANSTEKLQGIVLASTEGTPSDPAKVTVSFKWRGVPLIERFYLNGTAVSNHRLTLEVGGE